MVPELKRCSERKAAETMYANTLRHIGYRVLASGRFAGESFSYTLSGEQMPVSCCHEKSFYRKSAHHAC